MRRLLFSIVILACYPGLLNGELLPATVRAERPDLKLVGQGQYTWFGFSIYDASLWSPDGNFSCCAPEHPVVLNLTYRQKIDRDHMARFTRKEWERLGLLDAETRNTWTSRLDSLWTETKAGDNLAALILPGRETRFYDDEGLIGIVPIPEFGPALLAIWLDPRAKDTQLRADLLGQG